MLAKLAKEHGGISRWINGGMRDSTDAWYRGNSIDLATVTDEMLDKPFQYYKAPYERNLDITIDQRDNMILFNDGWAVALKPYSYHKNNGTEEPHSIQRKPSKYGTGIGDTGDHNRTPSQFVAGGGKTQGQVYNPYGVSQDAAAARAIRNAYNNNKVDAEFYKQNGIKDREQAALGNMRDLKQRGANLLRNHQSGSVTPCRCRNQKA